MAGATLNVSQKWAAGTTIGAYPRSNWSQAALPPSGAPVGAATTTAVVGADGSLVFTGLADATQYFAAKSDGVGGYVGFSTPSYNAVSIAEAKRKLWKPAIVEDETMPRLMCYTNSAVTSGTLKLCGGSAIRAGVPVRNITFFTTVALVTPTNQWFCLVRERDNAVLAKTVDDLTAAWNINTPKTLAFATPYVPAADEAVWLGILVAAATAPTLPGAAAVTVMSLEPGPVCCNADAGLTTPASLGATVTPGAVQSAAWAGWG